MSQGNYKAGEFSVESLAIVNQEDESVDITNLAIGVKLFESIYNKFTTGHVNVLDGLNILGNYKFTGQEFIRISVAQKEGIGQEPEKKFTIDKTFRIYKVENVKRPKEASQLFQIRFCDPRMFFCRKKRLSKMFRGSYEEMLQSALIEEAHIKPQEFDWFEETEPKNLQFICPNWTVSKFIDYVVNEANIGEKAEWKNGMFFFQTLNGGFRFSSIDTMLKREFPVPFSYRPRSGEETALLDLNAKGGLNSMIKSFYIPQQFDTLRGTAKGAYSSMQKTYDPIRKQEVDFVYDLEETMNRGKHLSGFPLIRTGEMERSLTLENQIDPMISPAVTEVDIDFPPNESYDSNVRYDFTSSHLFDNETTLDTDEVFQGYKSVDNARLERTALLEILQQNKIVVTIPMRTDLTVGNVIQLEIPQPEPTNKEDKLNDGRYLITDLSISMSIPSKEGEMYLECVKESFAAKIADVKPLQEVEPAEEV
jgi:hypothetical protein